MLQKFGFNQKTLQQEQWLEIGNKMKTSPYVRLKHVQYIAQAQQYQAKRFENMSYLVGGVLFLAFLKFPLIRVQPGFKRVGLSGILAYPFYNYMLSLSNKLKIKRIKYAYRKHIVSHGKHPQVYL